MRWKWSVRKCSLLLFVSCLLSMMLSACSDWSFDAGRHKSFQAADVAVNVNVFGTAANHVHSLMIPSSDILLLVTHYGTFRSLDDGKSWQQVTGGEQQTMQGLMGYSLVMSPFTYGRLYMLAMAAVNEPQGSPGLYTSVDQGRSWQLAITTANLHASNIYFVSTGNASINDVYIYLPERGSHGLLVSHDDGLHFSSNGSIPLGTIQGLQALPGLSGQLLIYGNDGIARSQDGGAHWQLLKGISGSIFEMTTAGPHDPIYASGDAGMYVSHDQGQSFTLVAHSSYTGLSVSVQQPEIVYGETGRRVYRSTDGGRHWHPLPTLHGNLGNLVVDSKDAMNVYISLSYPVAVYHFEQRRQRWISLTPRQ